MQRTPLWLGEGSTTYSQPIACSFAMLYNYLDILKECGLQGVQLFVAQALPAFFGNSCARLGGKGPKSGQPTPSYYFALLWKRLMGRTVYTATSPEPNLLVAARSGGRGNDAEAALMGHRSREPEGVFALATANLGERQPLSLALSGDRCVAYVLTPATTADGAGTKLNGVVLSADPDTGTLPSMGGVAVPCGAVRLPPLAVAFVRVEY
jgi:hypothetical protein